MTNNYEKMDILVIIKQANKLDEVITIEVGSEKFQIRIIERGLVEKSNENHKKDGDLWMREDEASSKKVSGMSDEKIIEEPNSLCNVLSVHVEGETNATLPVHVNSDLNIMGLDLGIEQIDGLETQCEDAFGVDLEWNEGAENQCLGANVERYNENELMSANLEVSQKSKQNQPLLSDSESHRDQISISEIEEEIFQVRQNKRKKKSLNKKIRSTREIQDTTLTSKEKQKRDRGLRKQKGKRILRIDDSIANLSLSNSNISNRRKVILREAKKTWEVGKRLGFSVHGDEEMIIEEIIRIEGKQKVRGFINDWNKGRFSANVELYGRRTIVDAGKWVLEEKEVTLINAYAPNRLADIGLILTG
ncbi:hypothetical protein CXB51_010713 [Gossypium anomalum]|uniref:Uncharacterized protein n=1 Tax=Gossypium anomalum TaxID=47600 RepID=A0A8J5Z397_9ROSI|nr:hypothetical protein CXB51_010713 [Gossypium anomalum]